MDFLLDNTRNIDIIPAKIIPELKDLIKVANDPNSLMADDLISESTKIPQVLKVKEVYLLMK